MWALAWKSHICGQVVTAEAQNLEESGTHVGLSVADVPLLCVLTVSASSLLFQVDVTKCVVNTDPSFRSHWLVSAVCAFGHYLKTTVLYLLREK